MSSPAILRRLELHESALEQDEPALSSQGPDVRLTEPAARDSGSLLDAQRLDSVGLLAGGIANDLSIALTPILMSAALLDEHVTDPGARRLLGILNDAAERGSELVQQMIEFARLAKRPNPVVTNPVRLLEDLRRLLAETLPRSIDLEIEVKADVPNINADPAKVRQLLSNLCTNAREAMPTGGLLTLRAGASDIDAATAARTQGAQPGRYVVLTVADNGSGIPATLRDRILKPFFTTKATSRGLGLTAVRDIAHAHGGFILVDSQLERGTAVKVFLPVCSASAAESSIGDSHLLPRGRGELVLVVEDESSLRLMMAEVLSGFGYRVVTASNGAEAVTRFGGQNGQKIAAVLTDLMMPLMDGAFTVSALRTIDPAVKLIALVDVDTPAADAEVPDFAAVLPKPVRISALLHVLRSVLDE